MIGALRKGRYFLKSVVVCYQTSLSFSRNSNVLLKFQTWSKISAKILSLGAGSVIVAGVILAQAARDNSPREEADLQCDVTENNTRARGGHKVKDKGQNETKAERKRLHDAVVESRDLIQRIKDEAGCPGVVIGVSVDGKTVWSEGVGFSDLENRIAIGPEKVFRIASISKSITMSIVAKLWESGKLDLDAPVQKYVPDFPEKSVNGEKVTITTRHLVSHLSGIRHYKKESMKTESEEKQDVKDKKSKEKKNDNERRNVEGDEKYKEFYLKKKFATTKEALELFKDDPLLHKPGSKFLYTTHGWTLVSAVLEGASGQTFPKLLTSLFKDLGMSSTYLDVNEPLIYHRGRHYVKNKKGRMINAPYVDNSYKWAGGGLLSTVGDLMKFGNVMLYSFQRDDGTNQVRGERKSEMKSKSKFECRSKMDGIGGNVNLPGYLKRETVQKLWTVVENASPGGETSWGYGMGWSVMPETYKYGFCEHQRYFVSHSGGAMGGSSILLVYPSDKNTQCQKHRRNESQGQGQGQQQSPVKKVLSVDNQSSGDVVSQSPSDGQDRLPQGIVVAVIANTSAVGLSKTAFNIAQIFEQVYR
ncbi:serine beta-lactamase-like protein LACTB, mitochondrial [Liolophura sinensis]|uniref:serine beta-lactamase-like protein LACTB, mitochondrial n=1 Tax=Liolophura sinensis TaxID=3198878 RepID=UPI0031580731